MVVIFTQITSEIITDMKWKCLRCDGIFDDSDKKCECETSPSPWVPLNDDLEEIPFDEWYNKKVR